MILSYKKYILFIPEKISDEDFSSEEFAKEFNKLRELLDIEEGFNSTLDEYIQERPDIIMLSWETGNKDVGLYVTQSFNQDPAISKHFIDTLKVLAKKINVEWLEITEYSFGPDNEEIPHENNFYIDDLINNFNKDIKVRKMPKTVFHGTSTNHLKNILKIGLRPDKTPTNFKNIYHTDRTFYTSSKAEAQYYTSQATNNIGGIPIILEVSTKNMDTSKIDIDYDFYVDYVKQGHEEYDDVYHASRHASRHHSVNKLNDTPVENLKKIKNKYIGATYRKFAYVGNIFPKEIIKIWYSKVWNNETFEEYFDEPLVNTSDMLEFFGWVEEMFGDEYYANYMNYEEDKEYLEEEAKREEQYELELQEKNYTNMKKYLQFIKEGGVTGVENHNTVSQGTTPIQTVKSTFDKDYSPQAAEMEVVFDDVQDTMKQLLQSDYNMSSEEANDWAKDLIVDTKQRQTDIKQMVATQSGEGNGSQAIAQNLIDKYLEKTEINKDFDSKYTDEEIPNKLMGE